MPTVTGAPTTAGTYNGAAELLRSFVKNGKYPASWFRVKPGTVIETVGPYTIRSDAAGSVTVSWPGNRKNWINVLFKNDGTPDPKFPLVRGDAKDDRSLLDRYSVSISGTRRPIPVQRRTLSD